VRIAIAIVIPVLAAALQAALAARLAIGEARPDLLALVVVSWSLSAGASEAIWWAFVGGLAADLWGGGPFGAYTVSLLPIGAVFGIGEGVGKRGIPAAAALVGAGAVAHQVLYALTLALAGRPLPEVAPLAGATVGSGIYTGALALVLYPLLRLLDRRTAKRPAFDW
jgi:rod shape-determining protein MreD